MLRAFRRAVKVDVSEEFKFVQAKCKQNTAHARVHTHSPLRRKVQASSEQLSGGVPPP